MTFYKSTRRHRHALDADRCAYCRLNAARRHWRKMGFDTKVEPCELLHDTVRLFRHPMAAATNKIPWQACMWSHPKAEPTECTCQAEGRSGLGRKAQLRAMGKAPPKKIKGPK